MFQPTAATNAPGLSQLSLQDGLLGRCRADHDIGIAHRALGVADEGGADLLGGGAAGALPPRPEAEFAERPHRGQRCGMGARLDAAPHDGDDFGVGDGELARRGGGARGRPHLGDQAAVEHRDRRAVLLVEDQDDRLVGRDIGAGIAVKEGDDLDRHRLADGRHRAHEGIVARHRQHLAHRLHDFARGKRDHRAFESLDRPGPVQNPGDRRLVMERQRLQALCHALFLDAAGPRLYLTLSGTG